MAAVALDVIQGTPAWLDARRNVVGSSDIPTITGSSPYRTSLLTLWAVKTRLLEPERPSPETQELFDLGHALEPVIAERYALMTGRPVRRRRHLLVHPRRPWMGASLDRVSARRGERRIVEIKWVPNSGWAGVEPVPAYVQDQVQWQLAVTGYDVADVAVLRGDHVEVHEIEPDTAYQENLAFLGADFWGYVERGERPPLDGSESTAEAIRRLHPRDTLGQMEPTTESDALASALREVVTARKGAEEEEGRLRNELRWLLREHSGVEGEDYRIHFRRSADRRVTETDWRAIALALRVLLLSGAAPADWAARRELAEATERRLTRTRVVEGSRSLIPKFKNVDTGKWT